MARTHVRSCMAGMPRARALTAHLLYAARPSQQVAAYSLTAPHPRRSYLELLADLPWAKLSTDGKPAAAPAGSDAAAGPTSADGTASTSTTSTSSASSLHAARELLDKQHYGLAKIKERIVQYLAGERRGQCVCLSA
jgi:hypothetical protein